MNKTQNTKIKVVDWVKECIENGAGEILLTSVKHDGLMRGFDIDMYNNICEILKYNILKKINMTMSLFLQIVTLMKSL